ncbi:MAG: hydrogenase maturation protease [Actinomycetia bacterium]|nr:hydrogenase maturation protease [Actinomycetes bacterium]MCP5031110.1 hydrogenase maturation protease [Actinomycetes bacterium]
MTTDRLTLGEPRQPVAVIGIGNTMRGDDSIGPVAIACLGPQKGIGDRVKLIVLDGEPARLIEAWRDRERVIVIDAAAGGGAPGEIHRIDIDTDPLPAPGAVASSHHGGLAEAVALGRALDRLPGQLIVYAMEAADLSLGAPLSEQARDALPQLIDQVINEALL